MGCWDLEPGRSADAVVGHLWLQIGLGQLLVLLGYCIRYVRWRLLLQAVKQDQSL